MAPPLVRGRHQGTGPASSKNPPVGPSSGRVARRIATAAERRTRRAAADRASVVLATKAGAFRELLARLLDAYAAKPSAVPVELMR